MWGSEREWRLGKREKVQRKDSSEWQNRKKTATEKDRRVELNPGDQVGGRWTTNDSSCGGERD